MLTFRIEINSTFEDVDFAVNQISKFLKNKDIIDSGNNFLYVIFTVRELIINAVEHGNKMIPDKKILCQLSYSEAKIRIQVKDEGIGFILPDFVSQPDTTTAKSVRGRGLTIINKMGFKLTVKKNQIVAALVFNTPSVK